MAHNSGRSMRSVSRRTGVIMWVAATALLAGFGGAQMSFDLGWDSPAPRTAAADLGWDSPAPRAAADLGWDAPPARRA
ncbi:hypothetical protein [Streptomyces sp. NPDC088915]|uniref:hypothetical protein n=1 Tax=Streptomyces sp. NPDC088915 TaxID=3365912 RepID=UPI0037FC35B2